MYLHNTLQNKIQGMKIRRIFEAHIGYIDYRLQYINESRLAKDYSEPNGTRGKQGKRTRSYVTKQHASNNHTSIHQIRTDVAETLEFLTVFKSRICYKLC